MVSIKNVPEMAINEVKPSKPVSYLYHFSEKYTSNQLIIIRRVHQRQHLYLLQAICIF